MNGKTKVKPVVVSYTLAAMAGISFVCGLVLLSSEASL
jgi:hypothetical protein